MQYFDLIIAFSAIAIVLFTTNYMRNLKKDLLYKIIIKKVINIPLFSTIVVHDFIKFILEKDKNRRSKILECIQNNDFFKLISEISDEKLRCKLDLILNNNLNEKIEIDEIYHLLKIQKKLNEGFFDEVIEMLNQPLLEKNKNNKILALKHLMQAKIALNEGDLLVSSEKAAAALKILKKNNMLYEEADCYFLLGNIYRMAGVFDSSDFMLRSSLKIFKFLGCYNKEVEVLGTLGLLMAIQKRFSEAIKYYKAAEEILENKNNSELLCYILGQQSILDLIQKNYSAAENIAIKALKHAFTGKTKAFALEVLCRIAFAKQKWKKTVQYAKDASKLYFNDRNYSSYFECEYLIAEANSNLGHVNVAETCLRKIIDQEKSHKSCFHIANAYTLLGLLLLKKNDVKGAKTVFSQSLNLELYNERNIGVAIDYTNLAIVEKKSGNIEKAKDNINIALEYAKDVDRELYENIKNLLN